MQSEIARAKGEIDALKVAVQTGQMPGAEAPAEGSLAHTVANLAARIATLEEAQKQVIDELENLRRTQTTNTISKKEKSPHKDTAKEDKKDDKANPPITNMSTLRTAYDKKRYKQISEDGEDVVKKLSSKDKEEGTFIYAESLFKWGKMREAALKFNELLEMKGVSSKHSAHAKMRLGDAFRHLGDAATAKLYYEELVQKYPNAPEAAKAKERIAELANAGGSDTKKGKKQ